MDLNGIEKKYEYLGVPELSFDISDLTQDELRGLVIDMKAIGWKFNRTEERYNTCTVAVFERI